jgi:hypothetical protein
MAKTDDVIFLLKDSGNLEKVPVKPYDSEDLLQSLIEKYPELLAGDQINPEDPIRWIMVKREVGVPGGEQQGDRWSIDHLFLDQNAVPAFVETKRSSDTSIRRKIVGQMLDYAANAERYWPIGHIRSVTETRYGGRDGAEAAIMRLLRLEPGGDMVSDLEAYWNKVEDNLRHRHIRLIFVADRLPSELRSIIEFINGQMEETEVLGLELAQYVGSNFKVLVPRVIGQTEATRLKKQQGTSAKKTISEEDFFNTLSGRVSSEDVDFTHRIIEDAQRLGCIIEMKTANFLIALLDPRGSGQKLSLLLVSTNGKLQLSELASQFHSVDLPDKIAHDYVRDSAQLFGRQLNTTTGRWAEPVTLEELRPRYQQFISIIQKTISRISQAANEKPYARE